MISSNPALHTRTVGYRDRHRQGRPTYSTRLRSFGETDKARVPSGLLPVTKLSMSLVAPAPRVTLSAAAHGGHGQLDVPWSGVTSSEKKRRYRCIAEASPCWCAACKKKKRGAPFLDYRSTEVNAMTLRWLSQLLAVLNRRNELLWLDIFRKSLSHSIITFLLLHSQGKKNK